jgi:hypothetical protein
VTAAPRASCQLPGCCELCLSGLLWAVLIWSVVCCACVVCCELCLSGLLWAVLVWSVVGCACWVCCEQCLSGLLWAVLIRSVVSCAYRVCCRLFLSRRLLWAVLIVPVVGCSYRDCSLGCAICCRLCLYGHVIRCAYRHLLYAVVVGTVFVDCSCRTCSCRLLLSSLVFLVVLIGPVETLCTPMEIV